MNGGYSRKIAFGGLLTALAIIFSYIEYLIPLSVGIPGIKLGLANIVVLFALYNTKSTEAFSINIIRVVVIGVLFGNMTSIVFSLCGATLSFVMMYILHRFTSRHIIVVSVCGAIAHIIGQLVAGIVWYPIKVLMYYGLFLLIAAFVTGLIIGILVNTLNTYYIRMH